MPAPGDSGPSQDGAASPASPRASPCGAPASAVLRRLRDRHPAIEIEVPAPNSTSDLRRREADIAVHNVRPTQNDLGARRLPVDTAGPFAERS